MNDRGTQHLTDAFDSIITTMLRVIRAHGWRCLIHLPVLLLVALYLRRVRREFATLAAAFDAGTLPPAAPVPPDLQSASACSPEAPRLAARPDPATPDRQRPAVRPALPARDAGPDRPRAEAGACSAAALPHVRHRAAIRPRPSRRAPRPYAVPGLPAGAIATGRSC
jgi:hypothetical protein